MAADSDSFSHQLGEFAKKVSDLAQSRTVPLGELMPPEFMRAHTSVASIGDLLAATGLPARTAEELTALPGDLWEKTVKSHTNFESWLEMQETAYVEWLQRKNEEK